MKNRTGYILEIILNIGDENDVDQKIYGPGYNTHCDVLRRLQ
ncbi:hypothetical protein [Methanomethylovorans hollandica]|jgi:hypothetical protein|nr:hypothetical protein [Methanomethylovorans hollandica]